jgi:hypothetical protein
MLTSIEMDERFHRNTYEKTTEMDTLAMNYFYLPVGVLKRPVKTDRPGFH